MVLAFMFVRTNCANHNTRRSSRMLTNNIYEVPFLFNPIYEPSLDISWKVVCYKKLHTVTQCSNTISRNGSFLGFPAYYRILCCRLTSH